MPGKQVYENKEWNIDGNMPAEEWQAWRRTAAIGQYVMISPTEDDKNQRSDELTVLINNYKSDTMMPWTVKDAIRQSQRFGDDGKLHEELYKFADNLKNQLSNSNITSLKDGNIDPYITVNHAASAGTSEDIDVRSLDAGSIHVIGHWGAMKACYFPYEVSVTFGRRAAEVIASSKELESTDFTNLRNYGKLVERLATVPITASAVEKIAIGDFITNVAAANAPAGNARVLPGNAYGSVNLPAGYVAVAGMLPYGYAGINHFRYLAAQVNNANLAAWRSLLEEIAEVVKSVDAYYGVLKKIVPDSALFNAENAPAFARSGVREYDEVIKHSSCHNNNTCEPLIRFPPLSSTRLSVATVIPCGFETLPVPPPPSPLDNNCCPSSILCSWTPRRILSLEARTTPLLLRISWQPSCARMCWTGC